MGYGSVRDPKVVLSEIAVYGVWSIHTTPAVQDLLGDATFAGIILISLTKRGLGWGSEGRGPVVFGQFLLSALSVFSGVPFALLFAGLLRFDDRTSGRKGGRELQTRV